MVKININLDKGLYRIGCIGGEGKTYLYSIISELSTVNDSYLAFTYDTKVNVLSILNEVDDAVKLIILDRLDLYVTDEIYGMLVELSNRCTIIADLKNDDYDMEYARIKLLCGEIKVWKE